MTGPRPNPLADAADERCAVDAPYTATVQELHLVALHILCAALDRTLGVGASRPGARAGSAVAAAGRAGPEGAAAGRRRRRPARRRPRRPRRPAVPGRARAGRSTTSTTSRDPAAPRLAALLAAGDGAEVVLVTALADDDGGDAAAAPAGAARAYGWSRRHPAATTPVKRGCAPAASRSLRLDTGSPATPGRRRLGRRWRPSRAAGAVLVADYGRGVTPGADAPGGRSSRRRGGPVVWDPHPRGADPVPGARARHAEPGRGGAFACAADPAAAGGRRGWPRSGARAERAGPALAASHAVAVTLGARGALLSHGESSPLGGAGAGRWRPVTRAAPATAFAVAAPRLADGRRRRRRPCRRRSPRPPAFVARVGRPRYAAGGPTGAGAGRRDGRACRPGSARPVGTVVATGGCFDLLHAGHVATLRAARGLGDCLVVCINSDESVRRLKGPSRPLVTAADRARVLEALECVDAVVVFDEDTPARGARPAASRRLGQGRRLRRRRPAGGGGAARLGRPGRRPALPRGRSTTGLVATAARHRGDERAARSLVLRALGLGDLLTGVPALRALRARGAGTPPGAGRDRARCARWPS